MEEEVDMFSHGDPLQDSDEEVEDWEETCVILQGTLRWARAHDCPCSAFMCAHYADAGVWRWCILEVVHPTHALSVKRELMH